MTDDVTITFSADISELQSALSQAASGVADTTTAMKAGASETSISFSALQQAYAAGIAQQVSLAQSASTQELAIARAGDKAQTDILLDDVKLKEAQVREEAQLDQISHADELTQLLALESQREEIETKHLAFLETTYQGNATAFANVQRQIDELAAQSALKRQQIESTVSRQIYTDYRQTFDQIASSASTQIGQLIQGQETLRQAVAKVLLSILESFIEARLKAVADWAAGVVAETAATQAGEAAKTSAVMAGTAARTAASETAAAASAASTLASIAKSIVASAAETFAGIFGFLAPVLGPAAAGPAVAGQATVLAAGATLPSLDAGAWSLPADMIAQLHKGEMVVPAGPAGALRDGQGWSTTYRSVLTTDVAAHVSGRESRAGRVAAAIWEITLTFEALSEAVSRDIETLAGFYAGREAGLLPFLMPVAAELGQGAALPCRFAEDQLDLEEFVATLVAARSLALRTVKP